MSMAGRRRSAQELLGPLLLLRRSRRVQPVVYMRAHVVRSRRQPPNGRCSGPAATAPALRFRVGPAPLNSSLGVLLVERHHVGLAGSPGVDQPRERGYGLPAVNVNRCTIRRALHCTHLRPPTPSPEPASSEMCPAARKHRAHQRGGSSTLRCQPPNRLFNGTLVRHRCSYLHERSRPLTR